MKPIISRLSSHGTLAFFPLLLILRSKFRYYMLLLLALIVLAGCFRKFYSPGTIDKVDMSTIERLRAGNKFFILHYRDSVLGLYNVAARDQVLSAEKIPLPVEHTRGLNPQVGKGNPLKNSYRNTLLSEVHLYVNKSKSEITNLPLLQVPLSDIYRVDIYEFDKKRSTNNTILSIVGIAAAVAITSLIIAGSSSSSSSNSDSCGCPQVYVEQKGNFAFQNGIFSGAVYSNLERMDYLALKTIEAGNSSIRLRIAGHDNEIQYLNFVQLIGVCHQPGTSVLADRDGKLFTIRDPRQPEIAKAQDDRDLEDVLEKADGNSFSFNTSTLNEEYSSASLTFTKPPATKNVKLVIRAKNTNWAARVNEEHTLLFGEEYFRHRDFQEKISHKKMEALLLRQGLPLKVYVETSGQWEYAGYFPLNGTEGYRDMVMEINLPGNTDEHFRLKLETVFNFWELDYAAIDYSDDALVQPLLLSPVVARHNQKGDQQTILAGKDKQYAELNANESIELEFHPVGQKDGRLVSYFLASSGYYHLTKIYPVKANLPRIKAFKQAGEFDRFSREKFLENQQWQALLKKFNSGTE